MKLDAATKSEITFWMADVRFKLWVKELDKRTDEYKKAEKAREVLSGRKQETKSPNP